jgi:hypothetical protein
MTANTTGMPRLFPSKTFSIYDTVVILTSTNSIAKYATDTADSKNNDN